MVGGSCGDDALERRAGGLGPGPEGAEDGGGEVVEDDVAGRVEGHGAAADDEGVAVLEYGDLADGEAARGPEGDGRSDAVGCGGGGGEEAKGEGEGRDPHVRFLRSGGRPL